MVFSNVFGFLNHPQAEYNVRIQKDILTWYHTARRDWASFLFLFFKFQVKFSLIKNNTEVVNMIFDGQGTNSSDWFSMSRVLESPWKDVHKGAQNNFFVINYQ